MKIQITEKDTNQTKTKQRKTKAKYQAVNLLSVKCCEWKKKQQKVRCI